MRVLHVTHSARDGAGRAAVRAHLACRAAGLSSDFASLSQAQADEDRIALSARPHREGGVSAVLETDVQWTLVRQARVDPKGALFSIPYPGVRVPDHPLVAAADVVHVHWPSWTVTPPALRALLDAGKTVFLTLHDMWAFTGGCHYAGECRQFRTICMKCPQIADRLGLANAIFEDKLAAYGGHEGLNVVALCGWMEELARASRILCRAAFHRIPNAIETDVFDPAGRAGLRAALGLGAGDLVLLFGNQDNLERRKGGETLLAALARLASETPEPGGRRLVLASFGRNSGLEVPDRFRHVDFGLVADDETLAGIYSVADVLCFPSVEDNYPNAVLEAAACGTPAIAFATGGMAEMVVPGRTGVLVEKRGDPHALAAAIAAFAHRHAGDEAMRAACRDRVLATNALAVVGEQLKAAYAAAHGADGARSESAADDPAARRARTLLRQVQLARDTTATSEFARFPVNAFVAARARGGTLGARPLRRFAAPGAPRRLRVMAVRTLHEHHSAHSGPYHFLRHLDPDAFEISNVTVPLGSDLVEDGEEARALRQMARALGLDGFAPQGNAWLAEWDIAARLRREPFDVVHFLDGELGGWLVPGLPDAFFRSGRPRFLSMFHQPPELLERMVSRPLARRLDAVGAVTAHQAASLRRLVPDRPVLTVPHGIDVDFFRPADPAPARDGSAPFRLLAVGHWLRDYETAFAALRHVAGRFAVEFTVVGPDPGTAAVPEFATVLSGLSDAALREEYRAADLLFMPLTSATANNALMESMACGTPVVTTAVGGVAEYVDETCGRLRPRDATALAAAVVELLDSDELRARLGRNARARAERFDWRQIADRFAAIYRGLAAGGDAIADEAAA